MYKVTIRPHWEVTHECDQALDTAVLLTLLQAIQRTGSIAKAAPMLGLSYRHAWGLVREAETLFGEALIAKGRGRGSTLTALADKLLWADRRVAARLSPMFDSLAAELEKELNKSDRQKAKAVRLHGSHGFAVAALLNHINDAGIALELRYSNSADAVAALFRRECDLAGFHVPLGQFERPALAYYAQWFNPDTHVLLQLAVRHQGLMVASGNPLQISSLHDLGRQDARFVNRQVGSGTRMLLELMLADTHLSRNDIPGFESAEYTHSAVAAYIASGMADVGLGLKAAAVHFGLDFIPLVRERYFYALRREALENPLLGRVIGVLQSPQFRSTVGAIDGYENTDTGRILSFEEAFGGRS